MKIVEQIKSDLKRRVTTGDQLPEKMTLESMAALYKVSITPVRIAVGELIAEGFLIKGKNRRLSAVEPTLPPNPDFQRVFESPLQDANQELLKRVSNELVHISLRGEALQIREEETAERYGVTRSAIRNVFHRLAGSSLLQHMPRRGWLVRPFRQEDLRSFLEVRELLELKALELSKPHLVDADLQRILDGNYVIPGETPKVVMDNSLHAYFIEKSQNHYISDFFQRHGQYFEILFDWEDENLEAAIQGVNQHRDILESLLKKNYRFAKRSLAMHIRSNHPVLSQIQMSLPDHTLPDQS